MKVGQRIRMTQPLRLNHRPAPGDVGTIVAMDSMYSHQCLVIMDKPKQGPPLTLSLIQARGAGWLTELQKQVVLILDEDEFEVFEPSGAEALFS